MSVALLFPGQGSQRPGMLASVAQMPVADDLFDRARALLGYDPRAFDDEIAYRSTMHVQIGLFLCGAICARALESHGVSPAIVAGHSVGAFSAAFAAHAIGFEPAIRAVELRARAMEALFPRGYGMGVCAGLASARVRQIVERAGTAAYIANVNAPTQTVIAGSVDALDTVLAQCARLGARRAERLPVAVPSHCVLLEPVSRELRAVLDEASFSAPACTYLSGMTGRAMRSAAEIHADLCDGVAREVRWNDVARLIEELRVTLTIESVPGRVLTDLFETPDAARHEAIDGLPLSSIVALARRA